VNPSPAVLIVDDFTDALEMYEEYLKFHGFRIVTATNGADAIAIAALERPAIVFMDLSMPSMTGAEALKILREDPAMRAVPIIALTAHALANERAMALRDGFDEVISKPCLPDDLLATVQRLLASERPAP